MSSAPTEPTNNFTGNIEVSVRSITAASVVEPGISGDPLLRNIDLPLRRVFHPLGFSIEVLTNSPEIMNVAQDSWGGLSRTFSGRPLELRIAVDESGPAGCPRAPVFRAQKNLLSIVADANTFAVCDRDEGFAFAWIARGLLDYPEYLRYYFLQSMALSLLSSFYVTPLHAACVEYAGKGILFCGNSGAGKSSLAFACARAGWRYISDDASYLVKKSKGRLVAGNPRQVRLRPSAGELFPDIAGLRPSDWTAGKPSVEIPTRSLPYISTAGFTNVEYIFFLNRMEVAGNELKPFPKEIARQWANQSPVATGDHDALRAASLSSLLDAQLLELRYQQLESAVDYLQRTILQGVR